MDNWVGSPANGYSGIKQKLVKCFPENQYRIKVVVFQEDSIDKVREIKEKIRNICKIGYNSVHITDRKEEVMRVSELIFNENGIHFLNYANPYKYHEFNQKNIEKIKEFCLKNKINLDDIVINSSMILSLYGLRKNEDIDFLTFSNNLQYHNEEKNNKYIIQSFILNRI